MTRQVDKNVSDTTLLQKKLVKMIPQHAWWSEECPVAWQYFHYILKSFVEQRKYFHPDYLSVTLAAIKNSFGQEKTSEQEKLAIYEWIKAKVRTDKHYLSKTYQKWLNVRKKLEREINNITSQSAAWGRVKLLSHYQSLIALAQDSVCWGCMIECVDVYNSNVLPQKVAMEIDSLTESERTAVTITLSTPPIISFMENFLAAKAKCVLVHRREITKFSSWSEVREVQKMRRTAKIFADNVQNILDQYQWITVNYAGSDPLTAARLFKQLKEDAAQESDAAIKRQLRQLASKVSRLKKQQKQLAKKYHFSRDLQRDFLIMRTFGQWIDERKESMLRTSFTLWHIIRPVA